MFLFCDRADEVWKLPPIQWDGLLQYRNDFQTRWEQLQKVDKENEGQTHIANTVNFLWKIWKSKNEWWFNMKWRETLNKLSKTMKEWTEFEHETSF